MSLTVPRLRQDPFSRRGFPQDLPVSLPECTCDPPTIPINRISPPAELPVNGRPKQWGGLLENYGSRFRSETARGVRLSRPPAITIWPSFLPLRQWIALRRTEQEFTAGAFDEQRVDEASAAANWIVQCLSDGGLRRGLGDAAQRCGWGPPGAGARAYWRPRPKNPLCSFSAASPVGGG